MTEYVLEAKDLVKTYDNGRIDALRGVNLQVEAGEFLAIRGRSGSGKSTLLHLLGGLDAPSRGEVRYRGTSLTKLPDLDRYRSQRIGFIFQASYLLPTLTAIQNVQMPMFEGNLSRQQRLAKAESFLWAVGLDGRLHQHPNELSAGECQRVAIARSLANSPEILLADEPTGNLDSENASLVLDVLGKIRADIKMTLIVVTHEEEVAERAGRVVHIRDGRICGEGRLP